MAGAAGTTGAASGGVSNSSQQAAKRKRGKYSGSTSNAYGSAILGLPFWKEGVEVGGFYTGTFETQNGTCYKFKCAVPSKLTVRVDDANRIVPDDEASKTIEIDSFAIGALAGFEMALDDMRGQGFKQFAIHDRVWIKCVGMQEPTSPNFSPMPLFEVVVE
jgi:hypothetical protein